MVASSARVCAASLHVGEGLGNHPEPGDYPDPGGAAPWPTIVLSTGDTLDRKGELEELIRLSLGELLSPV
jgi:hypothetical protein